MKATNGYSIAHLAIEKRSYIISSISTSAKYKKIRFCQQEQCVGRDYLDAVEVLATTSIAFSACYVPVMSNVNRTTKWPTTADQRVRQREE